MSTRQTLAQIRVKMMKYCAYQERCHSEVRAKLRELGVWSDDANEILSFLIEENFVNEERFARVYTHSKFYLLDWGKVKIKYELNQRHISAPNLRAALNEEIDPEDYRQTIKRLIQKKADSLPDNLSPLERKGRIVRFLQSKGYEWEAIEAGLAENA